jgi:hypothetical protein
VALVTELMVAPPGMLPPEIAAPTSRDVKFAVAEVTVVFELVAPSVTDRVADGYWTKLYLDTLAATNSVTIDSPL